MSSGYVYLYSIFKTAGELITYAHILSNGRLFQFSIDYVQKSRN